MDPDAAGAALKAGSVDAAVTWEPWITQLSGESGANVLYSTKDAPNILLDCVAVTTKPSNAEATKTFLSVLDAATKLVKADPKAAAELVAAKLELPASDIQDMLTKVTLYDSAESKAAMTSSIPAIAKELSDFFLSQGSTTRDVPAEEILSVDFIQ
jgi:NitT/TauT family transport system substrate-binding protein